MNTDRIHIRTLSATAGALLLAASQAIATPAMQPSAPETIVLASGDCYAVGQQIASQNGGQLAKATLSKRGGQNVCVIVVLVPAKDGGRPQRAEFVVPQG
ncbi:MAG: hypothetical protein AB7I79_07225 [Rhizobiaceae bacterium]